MSTKKPIVVESYDGIVFTEPSEGFFAHVQNNPAVIVPRLPPGFSLPPPVPSEDTDKRKRGDTKDNPLSQFGLVQGVPADEELKKKARPDRFAAVPKTDSQEEEKKKARALRSASMQQYWLLFSQFYAAVGDFQQPQQPTEAASFAAGFVATSVVFIACSNGA
ncbi:hypothetical protein U1Q18_010581 [Sarracenia purpurea var. burkii]